MRTPAATRTATAAAAMAGAVIAVVLALAPRAAEAKVRIAMPEFRVEGDGTPALALQLQDGLVLGLVRGGAEVIDPIDTPRRLEKTPELSVCDTSACLRNIGRILGARFLLRVKVDVAGNSYKMVARLFSTEGTSPAALPIATKSRSCDVCTVAEARDYMLRLADALKPDIEEQMALQSSALAAAATAPPSLLPPLVAAMAGAVATAAGIALYVSLPSCNGAVGAAGCGDYRQRGAVAGALIGAGVVTTAVGAYVTVARSRSPAAPAAAVTTIALALTF